MRIKAKYRGRCRCGAAVRPGDRVQWRRSAGITECAACEHGAESAPDYSDLAYEDACAAATGTDSESMRFGWSPEFD